MGIAEFLYFPSIPERATINRISRNLQGVLHPKEQYFCQWDSGQDIVKKSFQITATLTK